MSLITHLPQPVRRRVWAARAAVGQAVNVYRALTSLATSAGRTLNMQIETRVVVIGRDDDPVLPTPDGWNYAGEQN